MVRATCASLRLSLAFALVGLWLGSAGTAAAGSYSDFQMQVGIAGSEMTLSFDQLALASGTVVLPDPEGGTTTAILLNGSFGTANWMITWDRIEFDPDPFVSFVGGFSNLLPAATNFTFSTTTPITPLAASLIGGATTVSVADANFDGIGTLSNILGLPGYSGTVDGTNALDLLFPFSITVPFVGGVAFTGTSAGLPGPTIPYGPVAATIGITHRFTLTGNDNATFNSTFQVIPEPSTGLLMMAGLLGFAYRQRRHGRAA